MSKPISLLDLKQDFLDLIKTAFNLERDFINVYTVGSIKINVTRAALLSKLNNDPERLRLFYTLVNLVGPADAIIILMVVGTSMEDIIGFGSTEEINLVNDEQVETAINMCNIFGLYILLRGDVEITNQIIVSKKFPKIIQDRINNLKNPKLMICSCPRMIEPDLILSRMNIGGANRIVSNRINLSYGGSRTLKLLHTISKWVVSPDKAQTVDMREAMSIVATFAGKFPMEHVYKGWISSSTKYKTSGFQRQIQSLIANCLGYEDELLKFFLANRMQIAGTMQDTDPGYLALKSRYSLGQIMSKEFKELRPDNWGTECYCHHQAMQINRNNQPPANQDDLNNQPPPLVFA
jgi:hypothetical protein